MITNITTFHHKIQAQNNEIMENVNPGILEKIRATDEHPFFQSFVTIQEGKGTPAIIGEKSKPILWDRDSISSVKKVVNKYIQAFNGHIPGTNDTTGRKSLGSIAGHYEKIIKGRLSHVSIFYHPPEVKEEAKDFNACSHEGAWELQEFPEMYKAGKLQKLTGVALLKKEETPPALEGALKLGAVQAYNIGANSNEPDIIPPGKGNGDKMSNIDLSTISFKDLKSEFDRRQVWPSQMFTKEDILKDRGFSDVVSELTTGKEKITALETELTKIKAEKDGLILEKTKSTATPRLKESIKELPDKLKSFVEKEFERSLPSDVTDDGLKKFVESSTKKYDEYLQLFGNNADNDQNPLPPGPGAGNPSSGIDNPLLNQILGDI